MNLAKADKFVEPGFLMHWGEDMNTVAGDGGASCQRPSLPHTHSHILSHLCSLCLTYTLTHISARSTHFELNFCCNRHGGGGSSWLDQQQVTSTPRQLGQVRRQLALCLQAMFTQLTSREGTLIITSACSTLTCPRAPLSSYPHHVNCYLPCFTPLQTSALNLFTAGGAAVNRVAYLVEGGDVHIGGVPVKSKHMAVSSASVERALVAAWQSSKFRREAARLRRTSGS